MAKKILFVEDEPDILKIALFRLKKLGYEILTAIDGQKALDLIKENTPDLIILDLRIPIISGQDICKRLKADDKLKRIPVVLFTASADNISDVVKETGADDYLLKPFIPEALLEKVKKFIG